jgi:D-xylose transport system permease protein
MENSLESSHPKLSWSTIPWTRLVPILGLLLVVISFSLFSDAFLSDRNLTNLARQTSVSCILAFGMTCIILLGAIDLSIGSLLALGSVVGGLSQVQWGLSQWGVAGALLSMALVILTCSAVGAFTGGIVSKFKVPAFAVSLGVLVIARGLALILSGGSKIAPLSESYQWLGTSLIPPAPSLVIILLIAALGTANILKFHQQRLWLRIGVIWVVAGLCVRIFCSYQGVPTPVLILGLSFLAVSFILNRTTFGRFIYAIGGNPDAARLCGIGVGKMHFFVFVLMGFLVALCSVIEGGRINAGDPNAGNLYELDAIAAVVIGGTSLRGGVGTVSGTLLGALLLGTVNNGMSLMNIPTAYQMLIKGMIIILAVGLDFLSRRVFRNSDR